MSEAIAAAMRKIAGAGTRMRALSRLDQTANSPATLTTAMITPNRATSFTATRAQTCVGLVYVGLSGAPNLPEVLPTEIADQTSRHTFTDPID
jgi:hypothetical protein